jgi:hypothetical protein
MAAREREAVETVEIYNMYARPSMPAVCPTVAQGPASATQAAALGMSAVAVEVRTAPIFGIAGASGTTSKINFIGMAESLTATGVVRANRGHLVVNQLDKAKGVKVTDARGIPPRGWPV